MFTNATLNTSNWLQQQDHGSSIDTRPVLDSFSFGSRWVLVRSSFVSRSSLVAYSLVYRRPIENRSRTERGLNEFRTKEGRKKNEKMTENHRRLDGKLSSLMGVAPFCFSSFSLSQMGRIEHFCDFRVTFLEGTWRKRKNPSKSV